MKKNWNTFLLAIGCLLIACSPVFPNYAITILMGICFIVIWGVRTFKGR